MRVEWNLTWVYLALAIPLVFGLLAAWPFWVGGARDEIGAIVGSGVVLAFAVAFVAREYGEVAAVTARCIDEGIGCHFHPDAFVRYATFAGIAMCHVFAIFLVGLWHEERQRRRASTWWR